MNPFPLAVLLASLVWVQAQDPPKTWRVSERPILSIGSSDAEGPELFGSVEGAVRLSSGVVVVADGKSLELRFLLLYWGSSRVRPIWAEDRHSKERGVVDKH